MSKIDIEKLDLESISVKDVQAYKIVKRYLTPDYKERENIGLMHPFVIDKFKDIVFNCDRLDDETFINGFVHGVKGEGKISFKLNSPTPKRITLTLVHKNYEKSYYTFTIGNRSADVYFTTSISELQKLINQFIEM